MSTQLGFFDEGPPDEPPGVVLHRNPDFPDEMTLGEARELLAPLVPDGVTCPACGCLAHVARRNVHSSQARGLILLYRAGAAHEFVHSASVTDASANADVAKSVWWGLIEEESIRRPDGGRAGWYRLTSLGVRFVRAEATIQKYAHTFNKEVAWRSGEQVTIIDCLNNRFNYAELMGWTEAA